MPTTGTQYESLLPYSPLSTQNPHPESLTLRTGSPPGVLTAGCFEQMCTCTWLSFGDVD